jgi:hypothetical protein
MATVVTAGSTLTGSTGRIEGRRRFTDLGLALRVLACFSAALGFVLAILRETVVLGTGALRPIRFTINKPDIVPATTPAKNSRIVISKLIHSLAQRHIRVGLLRAFVADDSSTRGSSETVNLENLSPAGETDNHALAHSP